MYFRTGPQRLSLIRRPSPLPFAIDEGNPPLLGSADPIVVFHLDCGVDIGANCYSATAGSLIWAANCPFLWFVSRSFSAFGFQDKGPLIRLFQGQRCWLAGLRARLTVFAKADAEASLLWPGVRTFLPPSGDGARIPPRTQESSSRVTLASRCLVNPGPMHA